MTKPHFMTVVNDSRVRIPLEKMPHRVWLVLDRESIVNDGPKHHKNAFLEDRMHDWDWRDGVFRYYAHSAAPGDQVEIAIYYKEP